MTDEPDRILLQGIRLEARMGVSEDERALPQELELDVEVEADLAAAGASDDLRDTLDYGQLVDLCREVVEARDHRLLESIASTVAGRVLASPRASGVTVRVRKLAVPIDADLDFAQVTIHRHR